MNVLVTGVPNTPTPEIAHHAGAFVKVRGQKVRQLTPRFSKVGKKSEVVLT